MKNIAGAVGTLALRMVKIGATQTAVSKLQESSRKDIKEISEIERIKELKERKLSFKLIDKEDKVEMVEKKSAGTRVKETGKIVGFGAANLLKIGVKQQAVHSLNELNREEMREIHGQGSRYLKYEVSPKLKRVKKIEA